MTGDRIKADQKKPALGFRRVNCLLIDHSEHLSCVDLRHPNCLFQRYDLDLRPAFAAETESLAPAVDMQREGFVAFGRDQNFLCVRHWLVYNRP